jgi:superfamily II DNA/RNA helicase
MGRLHALILTPTRELAIQVQNHLVAATKYCDIRVLIYFTENYNMVIMTEFCFRLLRLSEEWHRKSRRGC